MIEQTVIEYLGGAISAPVSGVKPEGPPKRYVTVEKTGSSEENGLLTATLAVQCYGATLYEAAGLCQTVKSAMRGLVTIDNVFRCHCQTDYNFTSTTTKEPRYQAVFQVYYTE